MDALRVVLLCAIEDMSLTMHFGNKSPVRGQEQVIDYFKLHQISPEIRAASDSVRYILLS